MALPFPSNGAPAMPHPNNTPRFDDLEGLALGDIAAFAQRAGRVRGRVE